MTDRGIEKLREIQEDLACPGCGYNLRGLIGESVTCPECGQSIDVANLIGKRWTGPWYGAPGYTSICIPAAASLPYAIVTLVAMANYQRPDVFRAGWWIVFSLAYLPLWILAMNFARRSFDAKNWLWLSLLAHVVVALYMVGALGLIINVLELLMSMTSRYGVIYVIQGMTILVMVLLLVVGWLVERYIARHCIRRYLRRQACESGAADE